MKFLIRESQLNFLLESNEDLSQKIEQYKIEIADWFYNWFNQPQKIKQFSGFNPKISDDVKNFILNNIKITPFNNPEEYKKLTGRELQPSVEMGECNTKTNEILLDLQSIKTFTNLDSNLRNTLLHEIGHLVGNYLYRKKGINTEFRKPHNKDYPSWVSKYIFGNYPTRTQTYIVSSDENFTRMNQLRSGLSLPAITDTETMMNAILSGIDSGKMKLKKCVVNKSKSSDGKEIIFIVDPKICGAESSQDKNYKGKQTKLNELWYLYSYYIIESFVDAQSSDIGALLAMASKRINNEVHLNVEYLAKWNNDIAKKEGESSYAV